MEERYPHLPVMIQEVLEFLCPEKGGWFVDCTLGMGGHTQALLSGHPGVRVLGLDRDPEAIERATERLEEFGERFRTCRCDFKDTERWIEILKDERAEGILCDLGMSTYQLRAPRGFSFQDAKSLDMRMDPHQGSPVSDFVNTASQEELAGVFRRYGDESQAWRIAAAIIQARENAPIESAKALADIVSGAVSAKRRQGRVHPATKVFQSLRIHINGELDDLDGFLKRAGEALRPGGRLVVISYHSLEDRIVKGAFKDLAGRCTCPPRLPVCACGSRETLRPLTRKARRPTAEEMERNPSSRSARLRAGERL
jgi:16S rRNA (cytosine1402-N4)-methyltransferase